MKGLKETVQELTKILRVINKRIDKIEKEVFGESQQYDAFAEVEQEIEEEIREDEGKF